jgi:hypothetical protein
MDFIRIGTVYLSTAEIYRVEDTSAATPSVNLVTMHNTYPLAGADAAEVLAWAADNCCCCAPIVPPVQKDGKWTWSDGHTVPVTPETKTTPPAYTPKKKEPLAPVLK